MNDFIGWFYSAVLIVIGFMFLARGYLRKEHKAKKGELRSSDISVAIRRERRGRF